MLVLVLYAAESPACNCSRVGGGANGNQPQYRKSINYSKLAKQASAMSTEESSRMGMFSAACFTRYFTVGVLTAINLLNYMDRYTLAGKSPSLGSWRLRTPHDITCTRLASVPHLMCAHYLRVRSGVGYKVLDEKTFHLGTNFTKKMNDLLV